MFEFTPRQMRILEELVAAGFRPVAIPPYESALCLRRGECAVVLSQETTGGLKMLAPPSFIVDGNLSVKLRRGDKLKADDDTLFTGEWWTGVRGLELGLVDSLGDLHQVLRERFGSEVRIRTIAEKRPLFSLPRFGFSAFSGTGLTADVLATLEDRALWSRLGL